MSLFEHFNVYEDILSNYLLSQVKKKISGDELNVAIMLWN